MIVLREYEDFCNTHRPHRTLKQAAPLRPLPNGVTNLDRFRVQRRDRTGAVIHEYRLVAQVFGTHRRNSVAWAWRSWLMSVPMPAAAQYFFHRLCAAS
jgi:hypothetical protein